MESNYCVNYAKKPTKKEWSSVFLTGLIEPTAANRAGHHKLLMKGEYKYVTNGTGLGNASTLDWDVSGQLVPVDECDITTYIVGSNLFPYLKSDNANRGKIDVMINTIIPEGTSSGDWKIQVLDPAGLEIAKLDYSRTIKYRIPDPYYFPAKHTYTFNLIYDGNSVMADSTSEYYIIGVKEVLTFFSTGNSNEPWSTTGGYLVPGMKGRLKAIPDPVDAPAWPVSRLKVPKKEMKFINTSPYALASFEAGSPDTLLIKYKKTYDTTKTGSANFYCGDSMRDGIIVLSKKF